MVRGASVASPQGSRSRPVLARAAVTLLALAAVACRSSDPLPTIEQTPVADVAGITTTSATAAEAQPGAPDATLAPVAVASVHGVVRWQGRPPHQAFVRLDAADGSHKETVADLQGRYEFAGLPPGRYRVTATMESEPQECQPDGTCIGSALLSPEPRELTLAPGERRQIDFSD